MSLNNMLAELRNDYINELPETLKNLQIMIREQDTAGLRREFHKLKGSGLTYGVPEVSIVCEIVEILCDRDAPSGMIASTHGVVLLGKIHNHYVTGDRFELSEEARFQTLKRL